MGAGVPSTMRTQFECGDICAVLRVYAGTEWGVEENSILQRLESLACIPDFVVHWLGDLGQVISILQASAYIHAMCMWVYERHRVHMHVHKLVPGSPLPL